MTDDAQTTANTTESEDPQTEEMSEEPRRCTATTARGTRCKNNALPDSEYCTVHYRLLVEEAAAGDAETPAEDAALEDLSEEELRALLREELNRLVESLEETEPAFQPPPFSPTALITFLRANLARLQPRQRTAIINTLQESLESEYFDLETWKGIWYVLHYTLQYQRDVLKQRLTGEYPIDPFGMDPQFREAMKPFFIFLYRYWWRVEAAGVENVPDVGRVLMVSNHSGVLPWDGSMIAAAIELEHTYPRPVRPLILDWFPTLPFVSVLLEKAGGLLGTQENAERLLEEDELVLVFPEGIGGVGKLFKDRYRLARFGRGGFAQAALRTEAPIVPVAVVGAEEIYPMVGRSKLMAKLLGFPFFPITPFWPWLGLLGAVPLPTKWRIVFGEPIETASYGPEAAHNLNVVAELSDMVRNQIQSTLVEQLSERRSVFLG